MGYTDEQLIDPDPTSLRHADDNLALVDSDNAPKLPQRMPIKWVEKPNQHEDVPGQFLATRNHEVIRDWAEAIHAKPVVLRAGSRDDPMQTLRLQVSARRVSEYDHISWGEWFDWMDQADLVFIFQERSPDGGISDLYRLVPASDVHWPETREQAAEVVVDAAQTDTLEAGSA